MQMNPTIISVIQGTNEKGSGITDFFKIEKIPRRYRNKGIQIFE